MTTLPFSTFSSQRKPAPSREKRRAFGDDDESDPSDERAGAGAGPSGRATVAASLARQASRQAADAAAADAAARAENPDLYDFDGDNDDGDGGRSDDPATTTQRRPPPSNPPALADEAPRFIHRLIAQAAERKREDDIRRERRIRRDELEKAEAEGADPAERFITPAYRRRLEEDARWEADRRAADAVTERGAVGAGRDGEAGPGPTTGLDAAGGATAAAGLAASTPGGDGGSGGGSGDQGGAATEDPMSSGEEDGFDAAPTGRTRHDSDTEDAAAGAEEDEEAVWWAKVGAARQRFEARRVARDAVGARPPW